MHIHSWRDPCDSLSETTCCSYCMYRSSCSHPGAATSASHPSPLFGHCAAPLEQLGGWFRFKDTSAVDEGGRVYFSFATPPPPVASLPLTVSVLPQLGVPLLVRRSISIHFVAVERDPINCYSQIHRKKTGTALLNFFLTAHKIVTSIQESKTTTVYLIIHRLFLCHLHWICIFCCLCSRSLMLPRCHSKYSHVAKFLQWFEGASGCLWCAAEWHFKPRPSKMLYHYCTLSFKRQVFGDLLLHDFNQTIE